MTQSSEAQANLRRAEEINVATSMAWIIGSYLICWTPCTAYILFVIIYGADSLEYKSIASKLTGIVALMANHLSASIIPFIYAWRMKEVRSAIKRLFRCSQSVETSETTLSSLKT